MLNMPEPMGQIETKHGITVLQIITMIVTLVPCYPLSILVSLHKVEATEKFGLNMRKLFI